MKIGKSVSQKKNGFTQHHFRKNSKWGLFNSVFPNIQKNGAGFTLIDVLVGTFLMLIVFLGIAGVFFLGAKVVFQSKARIEATAIANGEIEKIRNLAYKDVGVDGSFPNGVLEKEAIINRNQVEYKIERRVDFIADPADGISAPQDECPNDYKKVKIEVSWAGRFPDGIELVTDVMPDTFAQECEEIGGVLLVSVFDSLGEMISVPLIEIKDLETGENIKSATPGQGEHYFALEPGAYKIVVSKNEYNTERTYGIDEIAIPEKPHPNILEGELTEISFSIDKLSSFSIDTLTIIEEEPFPLSYVEFYLRGDKIIGYDEDEEPVYEYSQVHITDLSGHINISDLEWDSYTFSVDPATGFYLVDTEPSPQPIGLFPDTNMPVSLYLQAENSFFLIVQDLETQGPIFSAEARLYNTGLAYDEIQYTDENGITLFIPLVSATYNLEIEAPGYQGYTGTLAVFGDTTEIVSLERVE